MTYLRNATLGGLLASAVFISACSMMPMTSKAGDATATLSSASEVPVTKSTGTGSLQGHVNRDTRLFNWTVSYSGASGPVTGGHFHGPAMAGSNGPVVVPFSGSLASPISGSATLSDAQMADLMAGKWYVNLHTAANPGGEIRGQVMIRP